MPLNINNKIISIYFKLMKRRKKERELEKSSSWKPSIPLFSKSLWCPLLTLQYLSIFLLPTSMTTVTECWPAKRITTSSRRRWSKLLADLRGTSSLFRLATVCRLKIVHHSWPSEVDLRVRCCLSISHSLSLAFLECISLFFSR